MRCRQWTDLLLAMHLSCSIETYSSSVRNTNTTKFMLFQDKYRIVTNLSFKEKMMLPLSGLSREPRAWGLVTYFKSRRNCWKPAYLGYKLVYYKKCSKSPFLSARENNKGRFLPTQVKVVLFEQHLEFSLCFHPCLFIIVFCRLFSWLFLSFCILQI